MTVLLGKDAMDGTLGRWGGRLWGMYQQPGLLGHPSEAAALLLLAPPLTLAMAQHYPRQLRGPYCRVVKTRV